MVLLEIACFSVGDAMIAWKAGADRIELCDQRDAGGTTPSWSSIVDTKSFVDIPVNVMIRPRGGDFDYSDDEFQLMKADIQRFRPSVDGFVFGILTDAGTIDVARTAELVRLARPLPCTFHRAIDEATSPLEGLDAVVDTGCAAILTSGGATDAISGASTIANMVKLARGRIEIIPGGGVRGSNLVDLRQSTQASVFHSSGSLNGPVPEADEIRHMKQLLQPRINGES